MRLNRLPRRRSRLGFTLVEMIGVLAVIGILAGMLIPRVLSAIAAARVNGTAVGVNAVKNAAMLYIGKYGKFGGTNGTPLTLGTATATNWDTYVLMYEGLLEKPLGTPIGTNGFVQVVAALSPTSATTGTNSAYNLDGNSAQPNDAGLGTVVIECVFQGTPLDDARNLNLIIDGNNALLGEDTAGHDVLGRCKYDFAGGSVGEVHVYVANK